MGRTVFFLFAFIPFCLAFATAVSDPDPFYGKQASEAVLSFDYTVRFRSKNSPTEKKMKQEIEDQVLHLFGPMGVSEHPAVPKTDHQLTRIQLVENNRASHTREVSYHYEGHILIKNGADGDYSIFLPIDPDKIYSAGIVKVKGRKTYPCTSDEYQTKGDFWYFWNPLQKGCPLEQGVDYDKVTAHLKLLPPTRATYPRYPELIDKKDKKTGIIRFDILIGMDDENNGRDPFQTEDFAGDTFQASHFRLLEMGFTVRRWSDEEILGVTRKPKGELPYVEEFEKQTRLAKIVVRLFFGPSDIQEDSRAFHHFYRDALENASVLIYDGHSGLGDFLDLPAIEKAERFKIQLKQGYQIYFFNSCSSYPYYNEMYFSRKARGDDPKGTKKLNIITNGLSTGFIASEDSDLMLVRAVDDWANARNVWTYQRIIDEIDSDNLAAVNGDEDNPTTLPE